MDLILPPHLREAGHPVPRDDPPHDSRPIAAAATPAHLPPGGEARSRSTVFLRRPVCGLIDWRRTAPMPAATPHVSRPSSAAPSAGPDAR